MSMCIESKYTYPPNIYLLKVSNRKVEKGVKYVKN